MADCESEKTIGDAVAAWMTAPGEMRLHAGSFLAAYMSETGTNREKGG